MKTISFVNIKGGTGKTTLSIATACEIAKTKRVLFIDTDPQCSASLSLGQYDNPDNVTGLFLGHKTMPTKIKDNLDLIPSSWGVVNFGNAPESTLKESIKEYANFYDYCIIDAPGSMTSITRNGIKASNIIIVPSCLSFVDADATGFTLEQIEKMDVGCGVGVILNKIKTPRNKYEWEWHNSIVNCFIDNPKYPEIAECLLDIQIPLTQSLEKLTGKDDYKLHYRADKIISNFVKEITE